MTNQDTLNRMKDYSNADASKKARLLEEARQQKQEFQQQLDYLMERKQWHEAQAFEVTSEDRSEYFEMIDEDQAEIDQLLKSQKEPLSFLRYAEKYQANDFRTVQLSGEEVARREHENNTQSKDTN